MPGAFNSSQLEGTAPSNGRGSETGTGGGARCGLTAVMAAALVLGSAVSMAAQVDSAISCVRVDSIVKRLFDGYFATQSCVHDPRIKGPALTPCFVSADFNGDRARDLAVAAWPCISPEKRKHPQTPFRLLTFRGTSANTPAAREQYVDPRSPELERLLIILHGSPDVDFEDTPIEDRLVLRGTRGDANVMALFYGRLKPAASGDKRPPVPPPKGSIARIMLTTIYGIEAEVIYWNGESYSWYPWYRKDY